VIDTGRHRSSIGTLGLGIKLPSNKKPRASPPKANLARLPPRHVDGIFMADYEQGDISHDLFHAVCRVGLEGIVSKHRDRANRNGKCRHWIKVKNRAHPAYGRVADLHWAVRR
jgi:hypothetical protein